VRRGAPPRQRGRTPCFTRVSARQLADAYGVTDTDGSRPDCWGYYATDGWEPEDHRGIDEFR